MNQVVGLRDVRARGSVRACCAAFIVIVVAAAPLRAFGDSSAEKLEAEARGFITKVEARFAPLEAAANQAWWEASTTGTDAAFEQSRQAQNKINLLLADRSLFAELKRIHADVEQKQAKVEPLVARQIKLLYLQFLGKQVDPALLEEITKLSSKIEQAFNTYRAELDGKKFSDNELNRILRESTKSPEVQRAWEGTKGIGPAIEADLKELVKKRNQIADLLGFPNYHQMSLELEEYETEKLVKLFDDLDELTRDDFRKAKAEIDVRLAKRFGIEVAQLRPWHYQNPFFQEAPSVYDVNLDALYEGKDISQLSESFYVSIGLPVEKVLRGSDLYPKDGKSPHAFCSDVDRHGDVRVLANIAADERWANTMLHELGHAVYSSINYPQQMPYFLRGPSHTLTTEGLAMMFERQTKVLDWMEDMQLAPADPAAKKAAAETAMIMLRNKLLIFSRWAQVMFRFEKAMYEDPERDLNSAWWDLVEKYQLLTRPEKRNAPDYATKIHIVVAPVYYHNYALGELFASQLHHAMARDGLGGVSPHGLSYHGDLRVGKFIQKAVIDPAASLHWDDLTLQATGARLNPKAFAEDIAAFAPRNRM